MNRRNAQHPAQPQSKTSVSAFRHRGVNWLRRRWKKPAIKGMLWFFSNLATFVLGGFLPQLMPWAIEHFTAPHVVSIFILVYRTDQPKCTITTLSIAPGNEIKSLHISLDFPQEIHATALRRGYRKSGNNVTVSTEGSTPLFTVPPCEIASSSADKDESLTFTTSSDHHQIIVSGHDLTFYDTQNLLVALYPDETVAAT